MMNIDQKTIRNLSFGSIKWNVTPPHQYYGFILAGGNSKQDGLSDVPSWVTDLFEECAKIAGVNVNAYSVVICDTEDTALVNYTYEEIRIDYSTFIRPYVISPLDFERTREHLKFVVLHELRHLHQYSNRYLVYDHELGEQRWMGLPKSKIVSKKKTYFDYFILPFEIDANAFAMLHVNTELMKGFFLFDEITETMKFHNLDFVLAYED